MELVGELAKRQGDKIDIVHRSRTFSLDTVGALRAFLRPIPTRSSPYMSHTITHYDKIMSKIICFVPITLPE
jgi:hypothetical protein